MSDTNFELNDDTVKTTAMGANVRVFGAESSAATRASSYGRDAIYATVQAALAADPATARAALDLEVGTDVQAYDADLTTLGAGGSGARTFLGLGTGDSPQFTGIELGHASDTTLTRSAAGVVAVEGVDLVSVSGTQTLTNKTLTAPRGVYYTLAKSGVAVARNSVNGAGDATPQTMATITVPAGAMGPNGAIRWRILWSYTNSASTKNLLARFGGTGGTVYSGINPTTTATYSEVREIWNRNSASSQVGAANGISAGLGTTAGAIVTSTENTANAVDLVFTAAWSAAASGETITLEGYEVEVCYGA